MSRPLLVTGGAGFIGSNFVLRHLRRAEACPIVNLDALTYAGNPCNLDALRNDLRHTLVQGDILDGELVRDLLQQHRPWAIVHLAAESHVDRSLLGPDAFLKTNVEGTFRLLQCTREYYEGLAAEERSAFRFVHVSTDEVYGSLQPKEAAFREESSYAPNNPYAASKAASDLLVRAWVQTHGLPAIITHSSNNYGPYQFPEKLIPLVIHRALGGDTIPIYGDGMQVRDWLHVDDHCDALQAVLAEGAVGQTYNMGGNNQWTNRDVVRAICALLDELRPKSTRYAEQMTLVADRPAHDRRYATDIRKVQGELGWSPQQDFENGLLRTVEWYLANPKWVADVTSGAYRDWIDTNYNQRTAKTVERQG